MVSLYYLLMFKFFTNPKWYACAYIGSVVILNSIWDQVQIDVLINDDYLDVAHSKDLSTSLKLKDLIKIQRVHVNYLQ